MTPLQLDPIIASAADERDLLAGVRFSICTLVNDAGQYARMCDSFRRGGFWEPECEYLYLNNIDMNRFDAYTGVNLFLRSARGAYIVVCHQDVELLEDGRDRLEMVIAELYDTYTMWGLFGNAGGTERGTLALRLSDPYGENQASGGPFPARVATLDENFIVVRRAANLAVSADLEGFHLYGAELCLVAERLGYQAYVADFHLRHHGRGTIDASFYEARQALIEKCRFASRRRWLTTTCTELPIMSSTTLHRLARSRRGTRLLKTMMKVERWLGVLLGLKARNGSTGFWAEAIFRARSHFRKQSSFNKSRVNEL